MSFTAPLFSIIDAADRLVLNGYVLEADAYSHPSPKTIYRLTLPDGDDTELEFANQTTQVDE